MFIEESICDIFDIRHPILDRRGRYIALAGRADAVVESLGNLIQSFGAAEIQKAANFRENRHRVDYIAAHLLARHTVKRLIGATFDSAIPRIRQRCDHCGGEHGKPHVVGRPDLTVSWAHQGGIVFCCAAEFAVGVDVEPRISRSSIDQSISYFLNAEELLTFERYQRSEGDICARLYALRQWVRKEAAIKLGAGSLDGISEIRVPSDSFPDLTSSQMVTYSSSAELCFLDWGSEKLDAIGAVAHR